MHKGGKVNKEQAKVIRVGETITVAGKAKDRKRK